MHYESWRAAFVAFGALFNCEASVSSHHLSAGFCIFSAIAILAALLCVQTAAAQSDCTPPAFSGDEKAWRSAYISWCRRNGGETGNFTDSSGSYSGWGCHPIQGQWKCGGSSSAAPAGTASDNPLVIFMQSFQKAMEEARAREAAERNASNALNDGIAAGASRDAEIKEDQAQTDDLAKYRAKRAAEERAGQNAFDDAHAKTSKFWKQNAALLPSNSEPTRGTPAQQKAWKQLHCLAYISRVAFEDLALDNIKDFHDLSSEAGKAFDGAATDVSCPSAPLPDLSGKNDVDMSKISGKLKGDLDQASQIAQRMEPYHGQQKQLPPIPPDVASDPKLAAAWKAQQAINALNNAPNPGKTPEEFAQVIRDRDKLRKAIGDANNAANGDFGSIQVDLTPEASGPQSSSKSKP